MRRLLVLLLLAGCPHHTATPPPHPPIDNTGGQTGPHELLASLSRTACYGTCPVYTVTVFKDGAVEYKGEEFVKLTGSATGHLSLDALAQIDTLFASAHYFDLEDKYDSYDVTDNPSASTSWSHDGKTKTIDHYYGDMHAPEVLGTVEAGLDKIVNIEQWIGTQEERDHLRGGY